MRYTAFVSFTAIASMFFCVNAFAEDYVITLDNHQFTPQKLEVPVGQNIKLIVKNNQSSPAEFESSELDREKVIGAHSQIVVNLAPLDTGKYTYFDDFHRDTSGTIIAK